VTVDDDGARSRRDGLDDAVEGRHGSGLDEEQAPSRGRRRLRGEVADLTAARLFPWWDGFRGTVSMDGKRVTTQGTFQFLDDDTNRVRITELPVGTWTKDYKAFLDELIVSTDPKASDNASAARVLKGFQEAYNDVDVEFVLTLDAEYYHEARAFPNEFIKKFKLSSSTALSNMVAFDDGKIRRFASAGEILETFYVRRLGGYVGRKASELARLDADIVELDARVRFVRAVVDGDLVVSNADDDVLFADMQALGLPLLPASTASLDGYDYLLRMRVDRLKKKAVVELSEELVKITAERAALAARSPEDLWLTDLDAFSTAYVAFGAARAAARTQVAPTTKKVVKKAAAKK
jgi:DNA topoisomerase-2